MANARILLVEDDELIGILIEDALASVGFEVVMCENGQVAWELLKSGDTAFDTILLDKEMPFMNGIELLRKLKEDTTLAEIPVVMETSDSDEVSIQEGIEAGAYYYLIKPFKPNVLMAIVKAAIHNYHEYQRMLAGVVQAARPFEYLDHGIFHFRHIDEGRLLANFFAQAYGIGHP